VTDQSKSKKELIAELERYRALRLEHRLAESEKLLRLTGDLSKIGTWRVDVVANTLHWSDEVYTIHGRRRDDFSPDVDSAIEHYHPDDRQYVATCVQEAIEHRQDFAFELRIIRADGEIRRVISRGRPEFGDEGVHSIIGIFRDVTEERELEAERFRSHESLRAHLENTPLAVIEWDTEFRVAAWNARSEEIFGYTKDEAMGRHATELILPAELHEWAHTHFQDTLRLGGTSTRVNENRVKGGGSITCEWYNTALFDSSGNPMGLASIAQDITERKILEAQLIESQKMEAIGTLAGGVAHDMNNVLAVVLGLCSVMQRELDAKSRHRQDIDDVLAAANRGREMVSNLLGFARKGAYTRTQWSPKLVIEPMVELLSKTIPKEISTSSDVAAGVEDLVGDANQITSALMNLCINSSHAIEGQGHISVSASNIEVRAGDYDEHPGLAPGAYVALRVSDNGKGMDEATRKRSIEPFFTTKDIGKGTGLGLSMVYGAAEHHHGALVLESEVGKGTTATLLLPVAELPLVVEVQRSEHKNRRAGTVLMIDDEAMLLKSVERMLGDNGSTVLLAHSGAIGLDIFRQQRDEIDVVLLDLSMPEMGGADCFDLLQEIDASVPVVICTGHGDERRAKAMIDAGAAGVLRKPFNVQELEDSLSDAMAT